MSKESYEVQQAYIKLAGDANAAASTKEFGAAVTTWITTEDPPTPPVPAGPTVTQNITEGQEISAPITWQATPGSQVATVDFYIDGSVKWTEKIDPYFFNGDGQKFDPASVAEGSHEFKVVATDGSGRTGQSVVHATVKKAVTPPQPTSKLPKAGISTGAIALSWDASTRAYAIDRMKNIAGGKPFVVRYDMSDSAVFYALCDACLANNLTPYIACYGTTGPRALDGLPAKIAARYKGRGIIFTGPNEPDLHGWQPDQLADFQVQLYNAITAVDNTALVGAPALWKGGPGIAAFAKSLAARAKGKFDFQPAHCYDDPTVRATWNIWDQVFIIPGSPIPQANTVQKIYANAAINVPIISDECGSKAAGQAQADYHKKLLDQTKNGLSGATFIFSLLPDYDSGWQMIDANHSEHVAYGAFVNYMKGM